MVGARIAIPSSPEASHRLRRVCQKDTAAEMALRRALHARGLRYRVDVMVIEKPQRVADIAIRAREVAVFVDGCFWHGRPVHGSTSKTNAEFWRNKIDTNKSRDADTARRLRAEGWKVDRVWEHKDPEVAADRIIEALRMKA